MTAQGHEGNTPPAVAVFGSSEPRPGEPAYTDAIRAGQRLAAAGWAVLTGGYGGVMEGASRGAREAGGQAFGVTVAAFKDRAGGNAWLTHEICEADLYTRTRALIDPARGYLILPGKAGTLAELAFLWALRRAGLLAGRPMVLCGAMWPGLVTTLTTAGVLDPATLERMWTAPQPDEAVDLLLEMLA